MNAVLKVMKMFNKIWPRNGGGDEIQPPDHGGFSGCAERATAPGGGSTAPSQ